MAKGHTYMAKKLQFEHRISMKNYKIMKIYLLRLLVEKWIIAKLFFFFTDLFIKTVTVDNLREFNCKLQIDTNLKSQL